MDAGGNSTGHRASSGRRTSGWVRLQDRIAAVVISGGGLVVLLAMLGICVFLVTSAAPLFAPGRSLGETARFSLGSEPPVWMGIDEAFGRLIALGADGVFRAHDLETGQVLAVLPAAEDGVAPVAVRSEAGEGWLTLSDEEGDFEIVRPAFSWEPISAQDAEELRLSDPMPGSFVQSFDDGSLRLWTMAIERRGPFKIGAVTGSADSRGKTERSRNFAAVGSEGLITGELSGRRALGGRVRFSAKADAEVVPLSELGSAPDWVFASGEGRWVYLVWTSGRIAAFDRAAAEGDARLLELVDANGKSDAAGVKNRTITAAAMSLGAETLLVGDSGGTISAWSVFGDPNRLQRRLSRSLGDAAITAIRPGDRDRTIVVGLADGSAVMFNQVSRKRIARITPAGIGSVSAVAASPGSDVFVVVGETGEATVTAIEPGHVESSFAALFGKLPYEGYDEPSFVYQSTGSASSEPKYSLVPLIWGTMKATVVAMLFAVPLAVLAAIYSGEFLSGRVRRFVKPTIELMASLPSVVLGFMAAMVVAPFVRDQLPRVLVLAATGPIAVVIAAHAWRMLPKATRVRLGTGGQFAAILMATLAGVLLAIPAGGWIETLLFSPPGDAIDGGGSIRGWLERDFGGATPGWFVVMMPLIVCVVLIVDATVLKPVWRAISDGAHRSSGVIGANGAEFSRLLINLAVSLGVAYAAGSGIAALGFDPRDSIFGPFSQRNTLVVGLIMGIAVIPIIYTISEDAIRSVPASLRSASLGVGATPWQTVVRVILPVAASGIFSACMVGLGRAVGETMIVLMATGNTPEMSWNIFSGFRTLAANIAVELPEAPRASTHYRVLFLCGLVLFAMTLVINTSAEVVRQHFRKKNGAL